MWWSKKKQKYSNEQQIKVDINASDLADTPAKHIVDNRSELHTKSLSQLSGTQLTEKIARTRSSPFMPLKDELLVKKIRVAISDSLKNCETSDGLEGRLKEITTDPKLIRLIIDTEPSYAYNLGTFLFGKQSGAIGKEWHALPSHCDDCRKLDNAKVGINKRFCADDTLGHPPLHAGCGCGMRIMYANEIGKLKNN